MAKDVSARRAQAVCEFLQDRGVDVRRMKFEGHGDERMLHDPKGPHGFQNRRVEVYVENK